MTRVFLCKQVIVNDQVSVDNALILVKDGKVVDVLTQSEKTMDRFKQDESVEIIDYNDEILVPGFIDMHTHGGVGVDFIDPNLEKVEAVAACLASEGVTSFCTSTMVLSREDEKALLGKLSGYTGIKHARNLGIHLEGPHMSPDYKAMMDVRYLRNPSVEEMKENLDITHGRLRMITMAPELEGAEEFIEFCFKHNITVMLGHSNASTKEALKAFEHGAKGFTHLYNAMSPHKHRNPGMVTAAFLSDGYCELIVDGYHIDPQVIKMTYDAIGPDRIMLITDSMPGKKMPDGLVEFGRLQCQVKDGKAFMVGSDRIAGSTIGMDDALRNMMAYTGCSLKDAVKMSSINASRCLGFDDQVGTLDVGKFADFVVLDDHHQVIATYLEGECTFDRQERN